MKYLKLLLCMAVFALFAIQAYSQDDMGLSGTGGYLDTNDNSAKQDIRSTMGGEDLFNPGKTGSTLGTGKKAAVAVTRDMLPSNAKAADTASVPASVAGRWSLTLTDGMDRFVNVMLAQSGDAIFGRGYMAYENTTQEVTATGTVSGKEVSLDLLAINDMNLYRLKLNLDGNLISGDYVAHSASAVPWTGEVEGSIA
jgi:hypothetical protein